MRLIAAALLVLTAACAGSSPQPAPPTQPSAVLIVTIDTLRADRIGIYGARNVETPNIDRLAREGAWVPQADVQVPMTRPSHISLFTGRYPAEHGIRDNISQPLAADVPVLAGAFHEAGYATAAFVSSAVLDRQSGLARGFDVYSDRFENGADRRSGDRTVAEAIDWLKAALASPKPPAKAGKFFAWVHLFEPHAPYQPPEPYASRYAGRPYDGTVAWADELVGRLVGALRDTGALDSTLVIVTSDHGESLGEHGEDTHGYFVYESTLRVPLVVRGPRIGPGITVDVLVRTVDLYPTILELASLGPPPRTSGRSIVSALRDGRMMDEPSYAESLTPLLHYGWSDLHAVRDGRWKYILAPKPELYDLQNDPGETTNIASTDTTHATVLRSAVENRLKQESSTASPSAAAGIPPETLERLGALGYVGAGRPIPPKSSGSTGTKADPSATNPKDKLEEYKLLSAAMQDALIAIRTSRFADAVAPLKNVEKRVDSYEVHYYLGRAYAGMQRPREAATEYEKATKRLPGGAEAWRGLGESRVALGDSRNAISAFEQLVALAPGDAVARMELGEALRDAGRYADAARVIREALALDPRPAQYWHSLGTVLGAAGDIPAAERAFAEAISREPNNGLYVYNHAAALYRLGRKEEAAAELARAAALGYKR